MAQWPAFFVPDGMNSADFEPHFPSARFVFPPKPTIRNPEEIAKWQCLPMTS
jgi:hypothetical protein